MVKILLIALILSFASARNFSVSGISSGGFQAVQMHIAHSADCIGAGIIAGGPYYCSQGSEVYATTACMTSPYLINLEACLQYAQEQSNSGTIDNLNNLKTNTKGVWIFSGLWDTVVNQYVVRSLLSFYQNFISSSIISTNFDTYAEHSWVTNSAGNPCNYLGSPFINYCNVNAAGLILNQIYGNIKAPVKAISQNLKSFDQTQYMNPTIAIMATTGYMYIPTGCQGTNINNCNVHMSIHGCGQNYETIGDLFITENELNGYAESNNIIMIYPQVAVNLELNPEGCWDFWGYTGSDYALKNGIQIAALYNMTQNIPTPLNSAEAF
ncbi:unnamed protein product [Blepharisma stoltei]|uniref:Uncharacterized protein n=1 Tax=Blepharisma stoltei TaxID=1481888 RepID=A0AAU9K6U0_9CILI|nr:unnamed protein product [Blepharisma stoltei]